MASNDVVDGSLALMAEDGKVVAFGYGQRNANDQVAMWSLGKVITALCVASLIKDCQLGLTDPIGPLLSPVYARFGPPIDARLPRITVAQLLSHRGGIPRAVDDNLFAPGLTELLRRVPPRQASIDMLMPAIMQVSLARDPGVDFEYTNMGYILLGQLIETLTCQSYAAACAERVFAPAGISDGPSLDHDWGRIYHAAGGWALSGTDFLAIARLLHTQPSNLFTLDLAEFLRSPEHKWIDPDHTVAYTLGLFVRVTDARRYFEGNGGHDWSQEDAAGGPIDEASGTSFVLTDGGAGWFASYDGLSAGTNPKAVQDLHRMLGVCLDRATNG